MAQKGSSDAGVHISHGKQIAEIKKNLSEVQGVVMKHDESIAELQRDMKVNKNVWMRDRNRT